MNELGEGALPTANPLQGGTRRYVQTARILRNEAGNGTNTAASSSFRVRHGSVRLRCTMHVGFIPDTSEDATIPAGVTLTLDAWGRTDRSPYGGRYVRGNQIIPGPSALPNDLPLAYEAVTGVDEWRGTVSVPAVGSGIAASGDLVVTATWEPGPSAATMSDDELRRLFEECKVEPGQVVTVYESGATPGCLQNLPLDGDMVGRWTFDGVMTDSSPTAANAAIANVGGVEAYELMGDDGCIQGFRFDDGAPGPGGHTPVTALIMPSKAALRLTGDTTIRFLFVARKTFVQTIFACLNAAASSVLYDAFVNAAITIDWFDDQGNRELQPPYSWTPHAVDGVPFTMHFVREFATPDEVKMYVDGVYKAKLSVTHPPSDGTERVVLGGFAANGFSTLLSGTMASLCISNVAITPARVLAESQYMRGLIHALP